MRKGFSTTLSTLISNIYITKSVGEILFDGYDDTLLDMARSMPFLADQGIPNYDKFGWFYMVCKFYNMIKVLTQHLLKLEEWFLYV